MMLEFWFGFALAYFLAGIALVAFEFWLGWRPYQTSTVATLGRVCVAPVAALILAFALPAWCVWDWWRWR